MCTQAVNILRSTSCIAIELNALHLKSYETQSSSGNINKFSEIGQQSLILIVFKMAALLVQMHETVKDYINSTENQALATEISSKRLQLSRAVIKKHTIDSKRAYKFHLAQSARMLSTSFAYWHKTILRKMK